MFTTPVVISNDGMIALNQVDVETFVVKLVFDTGNVEKQTLRARYVPPNGVLEAGARETVPLEHILYVPGSRVTLCDVALIVTFNNPYPFGRGTRVFRFSGIPQADGNLRLVQQPAEDVLEMYRQLKKTLPD